MEALAETIFAAPAAVVDVHMLLKGMRLVHSINSMHEEIKQFGGENTLSRSTIYRLSEQTLKERLADPKFFDIAGLHEAFVASFYADAAVIKMMIMEFRLRAAALGRLRSEEALFLLPQAINMLAEFERNPSATTAYRIAVSSFGLQVHVYCSRVPNISDEARLQHLLEARRRAEAIADDSLRVPQPKRRYRPCLPGRPNRVQRIPHREHSSAAGRAPRTQSAFRAARSNEDDVLQVEDQFGGCVAPDRQGGARTGRLPEHCRARSAGFSHRL